MPPDGPSALPALPVELLHAFLQYLDVAPLAAMRGVSKGYHRAASADDLWLSLSTHPHQRWDRWRGEPLPPRRRLEAERALPTRLGDWDNGAVAVSDSGLVVTCTPGLPQSNLALFTDRPVKASSSLRPCAFYFEVRLLRLHPGSCVSIGFVSRNYCRYAQVGWHPLSCGWHGDDAKLFVSQSTSGRAPMGSPWAEGDVVGCGLYRGHVFFVRNGILQPVGVSVAGGFPFSRLLFPAVGVDRASLGLNFGREPFLYDLNHPALPSLVVPESALPPGPAADVEGNQTPRSDSDNETVEEESLDLLGLSLAPY